MVSVFQLVRPVIVSVCYIVSVCVSMSCCCVEIFVYFCIKILTLLSMSNFMIGGLEVWFPSCPFESLEAYKPTRDTFLVAWSCENPVHTMTLSAILHAGWDCRAFTRPPFPVPSDGKCVFLIEHPSSSFVDHFEYFGRVLAGYKFVIACPWRVARGTLLCKIEDEVREDDVALYMLKDRLNEMKKGGSAHVVRN